MGRLADLGIKAVGVGVLGVLGRSVVGEKCFFLFFDFYLADLAPNLLLLGLLGDARACQRSSCTSFFCFFLVSAPTVLLGDGHIRLLLRVQT